MGRAEGGRQGNVPSSFSLIALDTLAARLIELPARRIIDFAAYIAIGLGFGLFSILFAYRDIDFKWVALSFETALVFGCLIAWQKRRWRVTAFWLVLTGILIAHLGLSVLLLRTIGKIRAVWVGLAFLVETSVLIESIDSLIPWFLRLGIRKRDHRL